MRGAARPRFRRGTRTPPCGRPRALPPDPMANELSRRILWADDEIDLLRPHIRFLEQKGFAVTPVPNGEDALAELGRGRYDVVLLDEMMPGMGGLATLDAIKARDHAVPVILVTKSEEESLMNEAIGKRKIGR